MSSDDFLFRAAMSFVIVGIGAALWFYGPVGEAAGAVGELEARHPDEPWLWREDCSQGYDTEPLRTGWRSGAAMARTRCPPISERLLFAKAIAARKEDAADRQSFNQLPRLLWRIDH